MNLNKLKTKFKALEKTCAISGLGQPDATI